MIFLEIIIIMEQFSIKIQYRRGIKYQEELQDVFMESNFFMFVVFEGVLKDFSRLWIQKKEN